MILQTLKKEWYVVVLLILPFIFSAYIWDELPDEVPTHFNLQGEADDWGPKWVNAIMFPAIGLGTYLLLVFLPLIDPKKRIESTQKPIAAIRIITSMFMVFMYVFIMAESLGTDINFSIYLQIAIGMLFLVLGNYMHSIKQNYFIGVRTPWTLENETVWKRTHRITAKVWTAGGLIMMIAPLTISHSVAYWSFFGVVIAVLVLVPVIYSYVIFQQLDSQTS
ncbi:MAG: SdpI family protein [bacterium]|nr:SdpI family protein [bacterium]